jgi:hypothetical protein
MRAAKQRAASARKVRVESESGSDDEESDGQMMRNMMKRSQDQENRRAALEARLAELSAAYQSAALAADSEAAAQDPSRLPSQVHALQHTPGILRSGSVRGSSEGPGRIQPSRGHDPLAELGKKACCSDRSVYSLSTKQVGCRYDRTSVHAVEQELPVTAAAGASSEPVQDGTPPPHQLPSGGAILSNSLLSFPALPAASRSGLPRGNTSRYGCVLAFGMHFLTFRMRPSSYFRNAVAFLHFRCGCVRACIRNAFACLHSECGCVIAFEMRLRACIRNTVSCLHSALPTFEMRLRACIQNADLFLNLECQWLFLPAECVCVLAFGMRPRACLRNAVTSCFRNAVIFLLSECGCFLAFEMRMRACSLNVFACVHSESGCLLAF